MRIDGQKLECRALLSTIGFMLRICRFVGLAMLMLVGCQNPSQLPLSVTTIHAPSHPAVGVPITEKAEPPIGIPAILTNAPTQKAVAAIWPTNWVNVWIPLQTWGHFNGIESITQHGSNQAPAFDLRGSNAIMSVKVGSKVARYDGLECWLAYTPQMIKGKPYIHSLDAQKN